MPVQLPAESSGPDAVAPASHPHLMAEMTEDQSTAPGEEVAQALHLLRPHPGLPAAAQGQWRV